MEALVATVWELCIVEVEGMCQIEEMSKLMRQHTPEVLIGVAAEVCTIVYDPGELETRHLPVGIPRHTRIIGHSITIEIVHDIDVHVFLVVPGILLHLRRVIDSKTTFQSVEDNPRRSLSIGSYLRQSKLDIERCAELVKLRVIIAGAQVSCSAGIEIVVGTPQRVFYQFACDMLAIEVRAKDMKNNGDDIVLVSGSPRERYRWCWRSLLMHLAGLWNVKTLLSKAINGSRERKGQKVDFYSHSP